MYCFHSFDSRLLQRDVQTRDFPLTVSESFPPFLSFISILFPLIPVFPPSFAFKSTSLHLFASSLPPSLDSLHLPPPPLSPESSLPSFAASLLYLFQSQSSHEPKVVPVRHFAGRPRALICECGCRTAAVLYDFQLNAATYKFLHLAHLHRIQRKCRLISLKHISSSRCSLPGFIASLTD